MRVVLDTNVLLSALIAPGSTPDALYEAWRDRRFQLASCERQFEEFSRVSRRDDLKKRITPSEAGRMVNRIRALAVMYDPLPKVERSSDPDDDWLLALAEASGADYLVTGDKSGLLALRRHGATRIVSAAEMVRILK